MGLRANCFRCEDPLCINSTLRPAVMKIPLQNQKTITSAAAKELFKSAVRLSRCLATWGLFFHCSHEGLRSNTQEIESLMTNTRSTHTQLNSTHSHVECHGNHCKALRTLGPNPPFCGRGYHILYRARAHQPGCVKKEENGIFLRGIRFCSCQLLLVAAFRQKPFEPNPDPLP